MAKKATKKKTIKVPRGETLWLAAVRGKTRPVVFRFKTEEERDAYVREVSAKGFEVMTAEMGAP